MPSLRQEVRYKISESAGNDLGIPHYFFLSKALGKHTFSLPSSLQQEEAVWGLMLNFIPKQDLEWKLKTKEYKQNKDIKAC